MLFCFGMILVALAILATTPVVTYLIFYELCEISISYRTLSPPIPPEVTRSLSPARLLF